MGEPYQWHGPPEVGLGDETLSPAEAEADSEDDNANAQSNSRDSEQLSLKTSQCRSDRGKRISGCHSYFTPFRGFESVEKQSRLKDLPPTRQEALGR